MENISNGSPHMVKRIMEIFSPESTDELSALVSICWEERFVDIKSFSHNIITLKLILLSSVHKYDDAKIQLVVKTFGLDKKGWDYLL
jgi:hypothetical protein